MWPFDLTQLMVELATIIALAPMTNIVETYLYELHPKDE